MGVFPHRVGCVGNTSSVAAPSGSRCLSLTSMYETHQSEGRLAARNYRSDRFGRRFPLEIGDEVIDDGAGGGARGAPHREIGMHGNAGQRPLCEDTYQRAIFEFAPACPAARRGDTETCYRRRDGAFVLVGREMRLELEGRYLAVSFESPCRRYSSGRPSDDTVPTKVLGSIGRAMAREVVRRSHDDARDRGDAPCRPGRIGKAAKSYGDVHGVPDDVMAPVPHLKLDMQIGVALGERSETWNDIADAEAGRHAHPDQPAQFTALADAVLRLVQSRQDWLDPRQEFSPGLGRHHGARSPGQKPGTKLGLEL